MATHVTWGDLVIVGGTAVTPGNGLIVTSSSNNKLASVTLTSGSAVVANASITANSVVFLTRAVLSGTAGNMPAYSTVSGTLTLTGGGASDNSTYKYLVVEPQ